MHDFPHKATRGTSIGSRSLKLVKVKLRNKGLNLIINNSGLRIQDPKMGKDGGSEPKLMFEDPSMEEEGFETWEELRSVTDEPLKMSSRMFDSVLVTGSNRGIGLELVRQLADSPSSPLHIFAGCRDPNGPRAQELLKLAQKHHDVITVVQLDTNSQASIADASKLVEAKLNGRGLNLIINNAGVNIPGSLAETGKREMVDVFTTNVVGPMLIAKSFHPLLCKAAAQFPHQTSMSCSRSAVVNVSTLLSSITRCSENFLISPMYPYRVSKAALNMLTCCLAEDFKKDGILVMSLHPGWVATEMGGPEAPLTTAESVSGMMEVIASLTEKHSGTLLDWEGKHIPW